MANAELTEILDFHVMATLGVKCFSLWPGEARFLCGANVMARW
jgi:hypothetical protein